MRKATKPQKRWRIDVRAELDLETITGAARDVDLSDLATADTHGLLLHEVRIGAGRTQIVASASDASAKAVATGLEARSGAKVQVGAAATARRRAARRS